VAKAQARRRRWVALRGGAVAGRLGLADGLGWGWGSGGLVRASVKKP